MPVYPREKHCQDVEREDYQHFESFSCSSHALLHHCDCVESFDCYRYVLTIKTKVSFQINLNFFPSYVQQYHGLESSPPQHQLSRQIVFNSRSPRARLHGCY